MRRSDGQQPKWNVDLLLDNPRTSPEYSNLPQYALDVADKLAKAYAIVRDHLQVAAERNRKWFDRRVHERSFNVGDQVRVYVPKRTTGRCPKLQSFFKDIGVIIRKVNEVTYVVHCKYWRGDRIVHVDKIQPYRSPERLENLFNVERAVSLITQPASQPPVDSVVTDCTSGHLSVTQHAVMCLFVSSDNYINHLPIDCSCFQSSADRRRSTSGRQPGAHRHLSNASATTSRRFHERQEGRGRKLKENPSLLVCLQKLLRLGRLNEYVCPIADCRRHHVDASWIESHVRCHHLIERAAVESVIRPFLQRFDRHRPVARSRSPTPDRRRRRWSSSSSSTRGPTPEVATNPAAPTAQSIARMDATTVVKGVIPPAAIERISSSTASGLLIYRPAVLPELSTTVETDDFDQAVMPAIAQPSSSPPTYVASTSSTRARQSSLVPVGRRNIPSPNDPESLIDCFPPVTVPAFATEMYEEIRNNTHLTFDEKYGPNGLLPFGFLYFAGDRQLRRVSDAKTPREVQAGRYLYDDMQLFCQHLAEKSESRRFVEECHLLEVYFRSQSREPPFDPTCYLNDGRTAADVIWYDCRRQAEPEPIPPPAGPQWSPSWGQDIDTDIVYPQPSTSTTTLAARRPLTAPLSRRIVQKRPSLEPPVSRRVTADLRSVGISTATSSAVQTDELRQPAYPSMDLLSFMLRHSSNVADGNLPGFSKVMSGLVDRLHAEPDVTLDEFLRFATTDSNPDTIAYRATLAVGAWYSARGLSLRSRRQNLLSLS